MCKYKTFTYLYRKLSQRAQLYETVIMTHPLVQRTYNIHIQPQANIRLHTHTYSTYMLQNAKRNFSIRVRVAYTFMQEHNMYVLRINTVQQF